MKKCIETNKICSQYNRKCKVCALDDVRKIYGMNDSAEAFLRQKEMEEFIKNIPFECRRCTLLEIDIVHKKIKCIYRTRNNRCMLESYGEEKC